MSEPPFTPPSPLSAPNGVVLAEQDTPSDPLEIAADAAALLRPDALLEAAAQGRALTAPITYGDRGRAHRRVRKPR